MPKVLVTESHLSDIADAIREKMPSSDTYNPGEMADAILQISGGGGGGGTDIPLFIDTMPTKVTYNDGETLSTSGIVVKLRNGATSTDVTADCIFEPADGDTLHFGDNIVKVIYGSYIRTYNITVIGQSYNSAFKSEDSATTISKTISCNVGDLIVATLITRGQSESFEPTLPSGWTVLKTVLLKSTTTYQKNIILSKVATSTTETFTASQATSGRMLVGMIAIPGAASCNVYNETHPDGGGATSVEIERPTGLVVWAFFALGTFTDEKMVIEGTPFMKEEADTSIAIGLRRCRLFIDQSVNANLSKFSFSVSLEEAPTWVFIPIVINGVTKIFEDGIHNFPNYASMVPLNVSENGTYTAPEGVAYSPVNVNVPSGEIDYSKIDSWLCYVSTEERYRSIDENGKIIASDSYHYMRRGYWNTISAKNIKHFIKCAFFAYSGVSWSENLKLALFKGTTNPDVGDTAFFVKDISFSLSSSNPAYVENLRNEIQNIPELDTGESYYLRLFSTSGGTSSSKGLELVFVFE